MRVTVRNCYLAVSHEMHAKYAHGTVWLCPGGHEGDKRIREADSLSALVEEIWPGGWIGGRSSSSSQPVLAERRDEPEYPLDVEDLADHAADLYERNLP